MARRRARKRGRSREGTDGKLSHYGRGFHQQTDAESGTDHD